MTVTLRRRPHRVNDADAAMRASEALWVHKPGTHPRWSANAKVDASRLFAKLEVGVYKLPQVDSAVLYDHFSIFSYKELPELWENYGAVYEFLIY